MSGISQIKTLMLRIFVVIYSLITVYEIKRQINIIGGWLDEMCTLLKQSVHLQEMGVAFHYPYEQSEIEHHRALLLKPFERLSGLKSVVVMGDVRKTSAAQLKKIMKRVVESQEGH
jgi:hypothetical protein